MVLLFVFSRSIKIVSNAPEAFVLATLFLAKKLPRRTLHRMSGSKYPIVEQATTFFKFTTSIVVYEVGVKSKYNLDGELRESNSSFRISDCGEIFEYNITEI